MTPIVLPEMTIGTTVSAVTCEKQLLCEASLETSSIARVTPERATRPIFPADR
jgi:hypothetical protein